MSGVVFTVGAQTPSRELDGQRYHFCCPACAGYFDKDPDRVLASRRAWVDPLH